MPDDKNQNNQNYNANNGQNGGQFDPQADPQNLGYSSNPPYPQPNQQYNDSANQFDVGTTPANGSYANQGYSSDFNGADTNSSFDPYSSSPDQYAGTSGQTQGFSNSVEYQPFGTEQTPPTTVLPLNEQFPNTTPVVNTFEQKKSGSKVFLFGSVAVVTILLIAMGVLVYFNFFNNQNSTPTNTATVDQTSNTNTPDANTSDSNNSSNEVVVDDGSTGGSNTPASQARVNSDIQISKDWLTKSFTRPDVDTTGSCLNPTVCGNQADPDNDGATNIVEYNFGTDPLSPDTDSDLLADGDELFVYFTSPKSKLSDSDNFNDGAEVTGCYDPTASSTTKMTNQRRSQIASNVTLRPLHEPTITLLKGASATASDIINRAVPLAACPPATETPTTPSTTTTGTPVAPNNTTNTQTAPTTPAAPTKIPN